jgi:hypothetical protein
MPTIYRSIPTSDGQLIRAAVNVDGTTLAPVHGVQNYAGGQINPATEETLISLRDAVTGQANYETVAASLADNILGSTGAIGDYLISLLIVPTSVSPGAVSIRDGAGTSIPVFSGGANSLSNFVPFSVSLGMKSKTGAWKVTTGANLTVIATGTFT